MRQLPVGQVDGYVPKNACVQLHLIRMTSWAARENWARLTYRNSLKLHDEKFSRRGHTSWFRYAHQQQRVSCWGRSQLWHFILREELTLENLMHDLVNRLGFISLWTLNHLRKNNEHRNTIEIDPWSNAKGEQENYALLKDILVMRNVMLILSRPYAQKVPNLHLYGSGQLAHNFSSHSYYTWTGLYSRKKFT